MEARSITNRCIVLALLIYTCVKCQIVTTELGDIKGLTSTAHDKRYIYTFKGIPYAQPPVGELRFRKTVAVKPWTSTLEATSFKPSCIQQLGASIIQLLENKDVSEDCLYLNIYVPNELSSLSKRSVMVFIHGGAYITGQSQLYDGRFLALHGDVIVVTLNYRLGILGYLSTKDENAPGNYGLWDQIEALKWIKRHISSFGGDPDSITLFGQSAGAFSVGFLSIIPSNKGLFQRVILQSGSFSSIVALVKDPLQKAKSLGQLLNCNDVNNTKVLVECLRGVSASQIKTMQSIFLATATSGLFQDAAIGLVVDNELIEDNPIDVLTNKSSDAYQHFSSLDLMSGCTSSEGSVFVYGLLDKYEKTNNYSISEGVPSSVLSDIFAPAIAAYFYQNNTKVVQAIIDKFGSSDSVVQARKVVDVLGDLVFYVPMFKMLDLHSADNNKRKTYMYNLSKYPPFNIGISTMPSWFRGSPHGADILFLFGLQRFPLLGIPVSEPYLTLSENMLSYWTNFAKTGDPNMSGKLSTWPNYQTLSRPYVNLDFTIKTDTNYLDDRMQFWTRDLRQIAGDSETSGAVNKKELFYRSLFFMYILLFMIFI